MSIQTGLPAVVSILQLGTGTLSSAAIVPASMTVAGVATTLGFSLAQIATTIGLPVGGGTGQILNKTDAGNFDTTWSNITQFVAVGTGLATSGSATSIVAAFATQTGLSVLGVGSTATAVPAAIGPATAAQVLVANDAGTGVLFGQVNLASSAAVKGVLPVPNGGTNTSAVTAWGVVYANNTSSLGATAPATTGWPLLAQGTTSAPAYGQLDFSLTGFTGVLGVPNGGHGTSTLTANGVVYGNGTSTVGITALGATGSLLQGNNAAPSFTTAAVLGTSLTVPTLFGGTAAASGIVIKGTSTSSPSGDTITLQVGGLTAILQKPNATTASVVFNQNATANFTTVFGVSISGIRVVGIDGQVAGFLANGFAAAPTNLFTRANGTAGGPSALAAGAPIGSIAANGYDGVSYSSSQALIRLLSNEAWNSTSHGTYIDFAVTGNGTTSLTAPAFAIYPAVLTSGGATAVLITPTAGFGIFVGTGSPTIAAATGSIYLRNDATNNTSRMYVNSNGSTTWTAFNTVA